MGNLVQHADFRTNVKQIKGVVFVTMTDILLMDEASDVELEGEKHVYMFDPENWKQVIAHSEDVMAEKPEVVENELEIARDMKEAKERGNDRSDSTPDRTS